MARNRVAGLLAKFYEYTKRLAVYEENKHVSIPPTLTIYINYFQ
jgi:hypothetical protein